MKVLILIKRSPTQRYLVELLTESIIKEVTDLINNKKHSQAVVAVFTKGILERQIFEDDLSGVDADLILSETNACWDLTK